MHTPGPWIARTFTVAAGEPKNDGSDIVADCCPLAGVRPLKQVEANARLIAAAPDLLAACKAVIAWATSECMPQGGKHDGPWEAIEAAIAKASP